ncbi:hypothetical protein ACFCV8_07300 [Streptomyces sp. NPDC056347]|uniref:hypothetical protein n=1 Tax=Streptomyces sp. NPDC056347 TaxID=3345790 RepID=UPI0035E102F8
MSRPKETDYTATLTMLHATVMNTGTDLRDTIGKGVERLEASGQTAQEATKQALVDELDRMRANLREARDRLTTGGDMLSAEVRGAVSALRTEMCEVKEALRALTPPAPLTAPQPPLTSNGSAPAAHTAPPNGAGPVSAAAGQMATEPTVVQDPAPQSATLVIPAQRDEELPDTHHAPVVARAAEIRLAVREALAQELAPLQATLEEQPTALLAGVREDVRAHLDGAVGGLRERIDEVREELLAELASLSQGAAELRAGMEQDAAGEPSVNVCEEHSALLREAARVSSATVLCHRDAWEFITAHAGRQPHFRAPAQVLGKEEERVRAALSGRSLIALLIALHSVKETATEGDGDKELATVLYDRVKESLTGLSATGRPVTITLDDRAAPGDITPASETDEPEPSPEPDGKPGEQPDEKSEGEKE